MAWSARMNWSTAPVRLAARGMCQAADHPRQQDSVTASSSRCRTGPLHRGSVQSSRCRVLVQCSHAAAWGPCIRGAPPACAARCWSSATVLPHGGPAWSPRLELALPGLVQRNRAAAQGPPPHRGPAGGGSRALSLRCRAWSSAVTLPHRGPHRTGALHGGARLELALPRLVQRVVQAAEHVLGKGPCMGGAP